MLKVVVFTLLEFAKIPLSVAEQLTLMAAGKQAHLDFTQMAATLLGSGIDAQLAKVTSNLPGKLQFFSFNALHTVSGSAIQAALSGHIHLEDAAAQLLSNGLSSAITPELMQGLEWADKRVFNSQAASRQVREQSAQQAPSAKSRNASKENVHQLPAAQSKPALRPQEFLRQLSLDETMADYAQWVEEFSFEAEVYESFIPSIPTLPGPVRRPSAPSTSSGFFGYVDAFNHGVETARDHVLQGTLQGLMHPLETLAGLAAVPAELAVMSFDGYNALADMAFGVSMQGSRERNELRGISVVDSIDSFVDGSGPTRFGMITTGVTGAILSGGANVGGMGGAKALSQGLSRFGVFGRKSGKVVGGEGTGAYLRNSANLGEGLGRLTDREVKISQKGYDLVSKHLAQFGPVEENQLMLKRLDYALKNNLPLTGADASFYIHEATEATKMLKGMEYMEAHQFALNKYQVSSFSVYHPDVIQEVNSMQPGSFNHKWVEFWDKYQLNISSKL